MNLADRSYPITVGRGLLSSCNEYFNLKRRVFIVTDSGVPEEYAKAVAALAERATVVTVPEGEDSKSLATFSSLLSKMLEFGMTRTDCAVAVGGGVVGDLTGFLAASYMRGIDFYNIPTTLLSQVDSSIGGKTAINLDGVKNIVGAFHQPKGVLVDLDTLKTLPKRQISSGLAEALKMSLTSDEELFALFENGDINDENIEKIVVAALKIKKQVVESDERESGLRKILNFGHTLGHAIESEEGMSGLYHGECVALGMLATVSEDIKPRLLRILKKLSLPTEYTGNLTEALNYICHDKKNDGGVLSVIFVDRVGSYRIEKITVSDFSDLVKRKI